MKLFPNINEWIDDRGLFHHQKNPTPDTSENESCFSGRTLQLLYLMRYDFDYARTLIGQRSYIDLQLLNGKSVSHDEWTGLLVSEQTLKQESTVPIFASLHPRDIVAYGYVKYPALFFPFLWIVSIAAIISCLQTKRHNDLQTSGKLLAFDRLIALKMYATFIICTLIIRLKKDFGSWHSVFKYYFKDNNHPAVVLIKEWENEIERNNA